MESRYSLSTKVTTAIVIVFTLAIIVLMGDNRLKDVLAGVWLIGCLFFFAMILSLRGATEYNNSTTTYEV